MKELKFRAWAPTWKIMQYDNVGSGNIYEAKFIQMSTGMKDKSGKEIYEGDVVKFLDWGETGIVEYDKDQYLVRPIRPRQTSYKIVGVNWSKHIAVIGNIHENPELVKEDKDVQPKYGGLENSS